MPWLPGVPASGAADTGYHERFTAARQRVLAGDAGWADRTDIDSCLRVWFELHEDLISSLGLNRATGHTFR